MLSNWKFMLWFAAFLGSHKHLTHHYKNGHTLKRILTEVFANPKFGVISRSWICSCCGELRCH